MRLGDFKEGKFYEIKTVNNVIIKVKLNQIRINTNSTDYIFENICNGEELLKNSSMKDKNKFNLFKFIDRFTEV